jgi:hypothetical protein
MREVQPVLSKFWQLDQVAKEKWAFTDKPKALFGMARYLYTL